MTIDEFLANDLRVGKIVAAERVEGSEKLLKLQVDLGDVTAGNADDVAPAPVLRQIVSGIAKAYAPENLVGREVVIIANLEPRMIMGLQSQGMILAAHGEGSAPVLLAPDAVVPPGSKIS